MRFIKESNEMTILLVIACVFIAVLGFAIYSSCTNELNRIDQGIIVDKQIHPGYTYYSYDASGSIMRSTPTTYSFTIRGKKNDQIVEYTFNVGDTYNR